MGLKYTDKSYARSIGIADGLTEQQMYIYLIAFLKVSQSKYLYVKIKELKRISMGKPFEQNVKDSLGKIGIIYGY